MPYDTWNLKSSSLLRLTLCLKQNKFIWTEHRWGEIPACYTPQSISPSPAVWCLSLEGGSPQRELSNVTGLTLDCRRNQVDQFPFPLTSHSGWVVQMLYRCVFQSWKLCSHRESDKSSSFQLLVIDRQLKRHWIVTICDIFQSKTT